MGPKWSAPGVVSGFIPYKSEITPIPMLERLSREGWRTCLPIVIAMEEPLVFRAWAPGEPLVKGRISYANPSALTLLGSHVVGEDAHLPRTGVPGRSLHAGGARLARGH